MTDPRVTRLARLLIDYSTELKSGETVLLDMIDVPDAMAIELMRAARDAGAIPIVEVRHSRITREVMKDTTEAHAATVRDIELQRMKEDGRVYRDSGERERERGFGHSSGSPRALQSHPAAGVEFSG